MAYRAAQCSNLLVEYLEPLGADPPSKVYVMGHSLGAANAQLFSVMYAFHRPLTWVVTTTFGSPRVGNRGFKIFSEQLRNLNLWRQVNDLDVVPGIPYDDYHLAGHLIRKSSIDHLSRAYYHQIGDNNKGWNGQSDFAIVMIKSTEEVEDLVIDHFMTQYMEWLTAVVATPEVNFTDHYELLQQKQ